MKIISIENLDSTILNRQKINKFREVFPYGVDIDNAQIDYILLQKIPECANWFTKQFMHRTLYIQDINLQDIKFAGNSFVGASLINVIMSGCDLKDTLFTGASLYKSDLSDTLHSYERRAHFAGTSLKHTKLNNLYLYKAHFTCAFMEACEIKYTDLGSADMWRVNLYDATIRDTNLSNAQLQEANLDRAHLERTNLHGADLKHSSFRYAQLIGCDFRNTIISSKYLRDKECWASNFRNTPLEGAYIMDVQY